VRSGSLDVAARIACQVCLGRSAGTLMHSSLEDALDDG
jgi:hypothetical protein